MLGGFDTADSHHSLHAFTWEPGGGLHFQEGLFNFTQVESVDGPVRKHDSGVFRFEPRTGKFAVFAAYGWSNPWGHYYDRWGQDFIADASSGWNHYATAVSGDLDYPRQHGELKTFLKKQWQAHLWLRALVSSRNFPDDVQGDFLLNNIIGFQVGAGRYKIAARRRFWASPPIRPSQCSSRAIATSARSIWNLAPTARFIWPISTIRSWDT